MVLLVDPMDVLNASMSLALSTPSTRNAKMALPEVPLATKPKAAETSLSDLPTLLSQVLNSSLELVELTKSLPLYDALVTFCPPSVSGMSASSSLALLGRLKDGSSWLALAPGLGVGTGVGDGVGVAALGVVDHQVGIGSHRHHALLRQAEQLGRRGGEQLNPSVGGDAPADDSAVMQQVDPVLDSWQPVGDLAEVALAQVLLAVEIE